MKLVPHTLHRSVLMDLLTAFVLGLLTFNFIIITEKVLRLTKVFASVGASLTDMLRILLLMQPQITVLTTPIAFLIAVLVTYGRMGADNELVIMRTSGMSFRQISTPVISFGIACFIFAMAASFYAAPAGVTRLRETISRTIAKRAPLAIEEGIFNTSFKGVVLYVNERTPDGDLKDIFIYDERTQGEPTVLLAREGRIETSEDMSITLNLRDGRIHMARDDSATVLSFGRYVLSFPLTLGDKPLRSFQELTPLKLWQAASRTRDEGEKKRITLELHRRLSLPALCLILMVLGPPLSLMAGRSGKMGGLAMGILVFAAYYGGVVYTEGQAMAGKIPIWLGAWGPALLLGVISMLLFRRASSR